jgi:hypothetical protein
MSILLVAGVDLALGWLHDSDHGSKLQLEHYTMAFTGTGSSLAFAKHGP